METKTFTFYNNNDNAPQLLQDWNDICEHVIFTKKKQNSESSRNNFNERKLIILHMFCWNWFKR